MTSSARQPLFRLVALALFAAVLGIAAFASKSTIADGPKKKSTGNPISTGQNSADRPFGLKKRVAWKTSTITGSPETPPPYKVERAFPKLSFKNPVALTEGPIDRRVFLAQVDGKVFSFPAESTTEKADLLVDLAEHVDGFERLYGITFHPNFDENRYCYLSYVLKQGLPDGTHVSRFVVQETDPPTIDPKSEVIVLSWLSGGHNGACLKFGPNDGYLYVTTGDGSGAFPPDTRDSGQDVSDLLASVLRIDVDNPEGDRLYSIPADNPFVGMEGARGEIWSYGHRNPWKMSFDRITGDLWVGDVGWEMWEMIYRVQRGGNYGWSIQEADQLVHPERKRGPTPILPATIAHSHTESRSITGGAVYRGSRLPELEGSYIYGDYVTGKIWGAKFDDEKVTSVTELVDSSLQVVCFGADHDGELYAVGYGDEGGLYRLVPNPSAAANENFPRKLSDTGLFDSVKEHRPAAGVLSYSINAEPWADGTIAERFVAVPGEAQLGVWDSTNVQVGYIKGQWKFPTDGVLAKTISLETEPGNAKSLRRLETQVLHFNVDTWNVYSYIWNEDQTDAELSDGSGRDLTLTVADATSPNGRRQQTYHFASRSECLLCHSTRGGTIYGFNPLQLNRTHNYTRLSDNQLRTLSHVGLFEVPVEPGEVDPIPNPHDESNDLDQRARAYLHVNCASCHRRGGGGTAHMDVQYHFDIKQTNLLKSPRPTQGTFGIFQPQVFSPGDPYRSVLYYRMAKLGRGRMPHFGSQAVDAQGLDLIHEWMSGYEIDEATAPELMEGRDAVARVRNRQLASLAKLVLGDGDAKSVLDELLSTSSGALIVLRAIDTNTFDNSLRTLAISLGSTHADIRIRDLFERFVPEENRVKRLGSVVNVGELLKLQGDAVRGEKLFSVEAGVQCRNCHQIGKVGKKLGADLTKIGKKYSRAELLESILEPSKKIDPKYVAWLAETVDGRVHTGLLVRRTDEEVVLLDATRKEVRIAAEDVEFLTRQTKSLMPELLLREMTAEQVADLLAYLSSLK